VIPFAHTAAFWISYGFTLAAFAVVAASIYIAFIKNPNARSRFYGFPIARIGVIYGVAQLIVSLLVMALALWVPWWIPTLVYAIGLGAAIIGLISAETVVAEIQAQDVKLKKDVSLMRSLQSEVSQIASQGEDAALTALAEEFRYSDPVSSDAVADAEADLVAAVNELQSAFVDGDQEVTAQLCRKISALLAERNRLCKLNKN
jgi:MFS family permease